MSHFVEYLSFLNIYGLIYKGVPEKYILFNEYTDLRLE